MRSLKQCRACANIRLMSVVREKRKKKYKFEEYSGLIIQKGFNNVSVVLVQN